MNVTCCETCDWEKYDCTKCGNESVTKEEIYAKTQYAG